MLTKGIIKVLLRNQVGFIWNFELLENILQKLPVFFNVMLNAYVGSISLSDIRLKLFAEVID